MKSKMTDHKQSRFELDLFEGDKRILTRERVKDVLQDIERDYESSRNLKLINVQSMASDKMLVVVYRRDASHSVGMEGIMRETRWVVRTATSGSGGVVETKWIKEDS